MQAAVEWLKNGKLVDKAKDALKQIRDYFKAKVGGWRSYVESAPEQTYSADTIVRLETAIDNLLDQAAEHIAAAHHAVQPAIAAAHS